MPRFRTNTSEGCTRESSYAKAAARRVTRIYANGKVRVAGSEPPAYAKATARQAKMPYLIRVIRGQNFSRVASEWVKPRLQRNKCDGNLILGRCPGFLLISRLWRERSGRSETGV